MVGGVASAETKERTQGGASSSQLAGIPSLVWVVEFKAGTCGIPGSGSTTMGVASPTVGSDTERTLASIYCLPVARHALRDGSPSTVVGTGEESAATGVVVPSTAVSMGLKSNQRVSLQ